jgi:hypothetical protein
MKIHEIIVEAIPISKYRDVMKKVGDVDYKSRYDEIFGGEMRLYFPVNIPANAVKQFHKQQQEDQFAELELLLIRCGYSDIDFDEKTATDKHNRPIRLGKALEKSINYIEKNYKDLPEVVADYKRAFRLWERVNQKATKELLAKTENEPLMVVISRHPYDIAGMSTGRDWSSCMNLDIGKNSKYVPIDIKNGTIIAYLVYASDKNIEHPIGRVLIKPYFNIDTWGDETRTMDNIMFGIEKKTYPPHAINIPNWLNIVLGWVNDVNSKSKSGRYHLPTDMYNDSIPLEIEK